MSLLIHVTAKEGGKVLDSGICGSDVGVESFLLAAVIKHTA